MGRTIGNLRILTSSNGLHLLLISATIKINDFTIPFNTEFLNQFCSFCRKAFCPPNFLSISSTAGVYLGMRIPKEKIDEIREAADIVDVIGTFVPLKPSGGNYKGICPFHSEKTPSFMVSRKKRIFHCFGCHVGGDVFKFISEYMKLNYVEAVHHIAKEYNITISYEQGGASAADDRQEILLDVNVQAARWYSDNLLNSPEGEQARKYFENRKLKISTLRAFGLGFAPPGNRELTDFLKEKGIEPEKALELGMLGKNDRGETYDRFRGRIMFPIFSTTGRVIGFGGRLLEQREGVGKYVNSPESIVYSKGKVLYGLSHSKDEIRKKDFAIVVEGYMDLISLYQEGIKNVVAASGTAFTEDQALLLSRFTKKAVLIFDADAAGVKASIRTIEVLLKKNFSIQVLALPTGEDPDSFVRKNGAEEFEKLLSGAKNFIEYQMMVYKSQGKFDDPASTSEAIKEMVQLLALIDDELTREVYLRSVSDTFRISHALVSDELKKTLQKLKRESVKQAPQVSQTNTTTIPDDLLDETPVPPAFLKNEKELFRFFTDGNESLLPRFLSRISIDDFSTPRHRRIMEAITEVFHANGTIEVPDVCNLLEQEDQTYFIEAVMEKHHLSVTSQKLIGPDTPELRSKMLTDLKKRFLTLRLESDKKHLLDQLRKSPESEKELLLERLQSVNEKIVELNTIKK